MKFDRQNTLCNTAYWIVCGQYRAIFSQLPSVCQAVNTFCLGGPALEYRHGNEIILCFLYFLQVRALPVLENRSWLISPTSLLIIIKKSSYSVVHDLRNWIGSLNNASIHEWHRTAFLMGVEIQDVYSKHVDKFRLSYMYTIAFCICRERTKLDYIRGDM